MKCKSGWSEMEVQKSGQFSHNTNIRYSLSIKKLNLSKLRFYSLIFPYGNICNSLAAAVCDFPVRERKSLSFPLFSAL